MSILMYTDVFWAHICPAQHMFACFYACMHVDVDMYACMASKC